MTFKIQNLFLEGPIAADMVANTIQKYSSSPTIGACSFFIGQIRADRVGERTVAAIYYTAYKEMAIERMRKISKEISEKYALVKIEIVHSLGEVAVGEICLFVLAASAHRKAAMEACDELVEKVKRELPIWGKECFADEGYQWKVNQ
ncbi:molybdenum cofactor biosynthesis protein MoaE [Olivibacter sp. SDN3]|uniref:molybdenum cofactor biosynthesis protein MoaE n=1 Tax=Olivibacter sp. SDN3 TaxID=2764720 RepID=UPI001650D74F|nr:molybdenum cofactor biosynthesis protein MoaE [Olivibacter sp. SDN3]QNL50156.1 molybdenum cofactor biosynthesis protein MoaE [Olivibacter sp. SDN3]